MARYKLFKRDTDRYTRCLKESVDNVSESWDGLARAGSHDVCGAYRNKLNPLSRWMLLKTEQHLVGIVLNHLGRQSGQRVKVVKMSAKLLLSMTAKNTIEQLYSFSSGRYIASAYRGLSLNHRQLEAGSLKNTEYMPFLVVYVR